MDKEPIAVDDDYEIRDNQFWYNDCSFRDLIEGKNSIEVKIIVKLNINDLDKFKDLEIIRKSARKLAKEPRTFYHSNKGKDGRITLSYTIPQEIQPDWEVLRHQMAKVELLYVK
nr:hypothetical protein [uncultured Methanolobus sp.]